MFNLENKQMKSNIKENDMNNECVVEELEITISKVTDLTNSKNTE